MKLEFYTETLGEDAIWGVLAPDNAKDAWHCLTWQVAFVTSANFAALKPRPMFRGAVPNGRPFDADVQRVRHVYLATYRGPRRCAV